MFSDPIADMLTRIRNGYMAKKNVVIIPFSNMKKAVALSLKDNKYIKEVNVVENNNKKDLEVTLLYVDGKPAINTIQRVSKTGRRVYKDRKSLPYVLSGLGQAIISTSQGVMTAQEARKKSLGGEIICKVW
jgi:small subunit ribosomal protein S8